VLRKTLFVIMSTISLWFTLFVICINICYNDLDCNNNVALHAMHGAQGEGWAPGHMHVGRRGKNVF